jgi:fructokinase
MPMNLDVAGTGFTVLDRVYSPDIPTFQTLGGSCGNVLVSLALLERSVAPVLSIGDDPVGHELVSEFEEAGALTDFIFQRRDRASPILAQQMDPASGQHTFSFVCPETDEAYPRYQPIEREEARRAEAALTACNIFYTDRVSEGILEAMRTAAASGAVVYFEPSAIDDFELFAQAVSLASIVKYSADRMQGFWSHAPLRSGSIAIITFGADGLEVRQEGQTVRCEATPAPLVRDTCGSGDMVSVGLIDHMLALGPFHSTPPVNDILRGIVAGQRLAAANCAYVGARGLFKTCGAQVVRQLLDDPTFRLDLQLDLFCLPVDHSAA